MRNPTRCILALAWLGVMPATLAAQNTSATMRQELLGHFDDSMGKMIALAQAMPATSFTWAPPGAMPVGQVYAHIARYNYYYPSTSMGVAVPTGIRLDTLEAMRDKAQIVALLRASAEHVRKSVNAMPAEQLDRQTVLYGRNVPQWAVLLQLVAHMNEHVGQSIAYARANGVVPPWSR